MAGYQHTTLGQAKSILATRLQDPLGIFWSPAELELYIIESLRTWQAYTQFYREREAFTTTSNIFNDLTNILAVNPGISSLTGPFTMNVLSTELISQILYLLLEPQYFSVWQGTDQFNYGQIQSAVQVRRDRFLSNTGCVLSYLLQTPSVTANTVRVSLPDSVSDVRRVAWKSASGVYTPLWRDDSWSINTFYSASQTSTDPPQVYSLSDTPPITIALYPPPLSSGMLELLLVQTGQPLTTNPALGVPDDFAWAVKFGALSDLFSTDGQSRDPQRAQYCEQRFQEGAQLARYLPSVLEAGINGLPIQTGSVYDLDGFAYGWQNQQGDLVSPYMAAMAGRNLCALAPTPFSGPSGFGVTLDIVRNMIIPATDAQFLQVGKGKVETILDYAQHLACLKMGGEEFMMTMKLYQNFITQAGLENHRIRQLAFYNDAIRQPSIRLNQQTPILEVPNSANYNNAAAPLTLQ